MSDRERPSAPSPGSSLPPDEEAHIDSLFDKLTDASLRPADPGTTAHTAGGHLAAPPAPALTPPPPSGSRPPAPRSSVPPARTPSSPRMSSVPAPTRRSSHPELARVRSSIPPPSVSLQPAGVVAGVLAQGRSDAPRDDGAAAARRTVRKRAGRRGALAYVGRGADVLRARAELLAHMAQRARGTLAARLWTATAELHAQLDEHEVAGAIRTRACGPEAVDVIGLRAGQRDAAAAGDHTRWVALLQVEAQQPLPPLERAMALTRAAALTLRHHTDAATAGALCQQALAIDPTAVDAALLWVRATRDAADPSAEAVAWRALAAAWKDTAGRAQAHVLAGHAAEAAEQPQRAWADYQAALREMPLNPDATLGVMRTARSEQPESAAQSAASLARNLHDPEARSAWLRAAARAAVLARDTRLARDLLAEDHSRLSVRMAARLNAAGDDSAAYRITLERWAQAAGGSERAVALVELARLAIDAGNYDAAEHALVDAAVADGNLGTVRMVRELLARKRGDAGSLAQVSVDDESEVLTAAAKIAGDAGQGAQERELLRRAARLGDDALTAEVIALDAAATAGDREAVFAASLRHAARARPEDRLGPLLSLLDYLPADAWGTRRDEIDHELRVSAADVPLAIRQRVRAQVDVLARAALWDAEAQAAQDDHAAFCGTLAGDLRLSQDGDPSGDYRAALQYAPNYEPAMWALERHARAQHDSDTLIDLHERLADIGRMHSERAARLFRAGILQAASAPDAAADRLRRALTERPGDAITTELLLRLSVRRPLEDLDTLLLQSAAHTGADVAHAARIRAGALQEDAGDWAAAARHYRFAHEATGTVDPFMRDALDRTELLANEHARVAQRLTDAVRDAQDPASRTVALSRLANFERDRGDMTSAVLALQSLREVSPHNVQTMRTLERYYLQKQRDEDLVDNTDALLDALAEPTDVAAYLRLRLALALRQSEPSDVRNAHLLTHAGHTAGDLWCMRRQETAAAVAQSSEQAWRAVAEQVSHLTDAFERASLCLRALELGGEAAASSVIPALASAVDAAPQHPVATEELGRLQEAAGQHHAAAVAFELAARAATTTERRVALWHRAGALWQDHDANEERALNALREAASMQLLYRDTFARLHQLLTTRGDRPALATLIEQRIAAGGDATLLASLHGELSLLRSDLHDRTGAKEGLRAALALASTHTGNWRALADLELADHQWSQAADALIQLARLSKDTDELRWAFFTLGDIYETKLPDLKRAEIAFSRAVKLAPDDADSIARLAKVFQGQGQLDMAERALRRLCDLRKADVDAWIGHQIELAQIIEQGADPRRAEETLEQVRRAHPLDVNINRAIEAHHQRQGDESARAMHLSRCINDYRNAILADIRHEQAWLGMVEMLERRGKRDAADLCAQVAHTLDVEAPTLRGRRRPATATATLLSTSIDDLIAPAGLTPSTRVVLSQLGPALEKLLAVDTRGPGAERAKQRNEAVTRALTTACAWTGIDRVELYTNRTHSCRVSDANPWTLAVGEALLQETSDAEKLFLFARALKLGVSELAVAVRSDSQLFGGAMHGLMRHIDSSYEPKGVDVAVMEEWSRRIGKMIPRKLRDDLAPNVMEMAGDNHADPSRLGHVCERFGARFALVATGDFAAAIGAVLRETHTNLPVGDARQAQQALQRHPVAGDLLTFALSDACFSAREIALSSSPGQGRH